MALAGVLFLTLSAATPASSMFVIVPDVVSQAGTGALLAMLIAAAIAVCIAQVYAELGSAFPLAGGEYAMVGRTVGPGAGFAVMGLNLANSVLNIAVLALGVADYLAAVLPGLQPVPTALAVVALATGLGVLDIRTNAWVTGAFVGVEIAALAALAALGFGQAHRSLGEMLLHPVALAHGVLAPVGPGAIGMAVAVALFAYDGYGAAIYFSEELVQPRHRIGRAIVLALVAVVAAEILPLAGLLAGAPDLRTLFGAQSMIGDFVAGAGGALAGRVISLAVALAIINAVIALVLLTARQLYGSGRDRTWPSPVNAALTRVHGRLGSPWAATLVAGALAASLCSIDLKLLLIANGAGVTLIYAVLCVAALVGRRRILAAGGRHRAPFHPWLAAGTLVVLIGVLVANGADPETGRPALGASLAVAAGFGLYYVIVIRRRGAWVLAPPPE